MMNWLQKTINLKPVRRGFHLVTDELISQLPELQQFSVGFAQFFIQHTSASLTINENCDPDVRVDLETASNALCPEDLPFQHTCEGPDDMPAHVKASLFGAQLLIPVQRGNLALGTWQGIYLCEHRNRGGSRRVIVTLMGQSQTRN